MILLLLRLNESFDMFNLLQVVDSMICDLLQTCDHLWKTKLEEPSLLSFQASLLFNEEGERDLLLILPTLRTFPFKQKRSPEFHHFSSVSKYSSVKFYEQAESERTKAKHLSTLTVFLVEWCLLFCIFCLQLAVVSQNSRQEHTNLISHREHD